MTFNRCRFTESCYIFEFIKVFFGHAKNFICISPKVLSNCKSYTTKTLSTLVSPYTFVDSFYLFLCFALISDAVTIGITLFLLGCVWNEYIIHIINQWHFSSLKFIIFLLLTLIKEFVFKVFWKRVILTTIMLNYDTYTSIKIGVLSYRFET